MMPDSPSPISRLADQFQKENLGDHGYEDSPDQPGGRLPLVDMLDTQLSFHTAAGNSSGGRSQDEEASPALRSIVQQAQKMQLQSARCPPAFRAWQASQPLPTPSPRPGLCNPKRKLWAPSPSSPAGDLHGHTGSGSIISSVSLPSKRHCGMTDAYSSRTAGSPGGQCKEFLSSASAPEPMLRDGDGYAAHAFCRPQPAASAADRRTHFGMGHRGLFAFVQSKNAGSRQAGAGPPCSGAQAPTGVEPAAEAAVDRAPRADPVPMSTSPSPLGQTAGSCAQSASTPGPWGQDWESPAPSAPPQYCAPPPAKRRSLSPLEPGIPSILPQADDVSTGLPSILPETLAAAVRGQGSLAGTRLLLLDCRYPYEHSGGCIRGALNVQFPSAALELTLEARNPAAGWLQTAVVFYCEFSSERAPRLFRHIRNADRKRHLGTYPQLDVPHMYVLNGGYKAFHRAYPELCTPEGGYVRMVDHRFADELRQCHSAAAAKWLGQDAGKKASRLQPAHNVLPLRQ